jgi:site-specific DNA recombinase
MHPKVTTGRVAIYARYSSDKQSETSIEDQVRRARDAIAHAGGDPDRATVFSDSAISGASLDRPGFQQLMKAVKDEKVDVILTEDVSRISRDVGDSAQFFKRLQFLGVPLVSLADGTDTSQKNAKMGFTLRSLMAEMGLDDIRDKTLRGLEGRHLAGFATGQVPYGYKLVKQQDRYGRDIGSEIQIDKQDAAVVKRIFEMYRDGAPLHHIARTLIREEIRSPRKRMRHGCFGWGPSGIGGMLQREKYIGIWRYKETQWVKEPGTNRRVPRKRPPEEVVTMERPDLRIIDDELWQAVQARLKQPKCGAEKRMERGRSRYLLSGILICDECGNPLTITGSNYTAYRCATRLKKGICGNDLLVREDVLRKECLDAIAETIRTPANVEYVREQVAERIKNHGKEIKNEVAHRRERLERAEARTKELIDLMTSGIKSKTISTELNQIEARIEADTAAVTRLQRELKEPVALPDPEEITADAFRVHELLTLDPDRSKRELVSWLQDGSIRVRKTPEGVELAGTVYPLRTIFRPTRKNPRKKPKDFGSLGMGSFDPGSGGGI